jgi:hypothetical protein
LDYAKRHPTNHLVRKYTAKIAETARVQETLKAAVLACEVACAALPNTPPPGPELPLPLPAAVPNFSAGVRPGDLDRMVNGGIPWQPPPPDLDFQAPESLTNCSPWVKSMLMQQLTTTKAMQEIVRCQSHKLRELEKQVQWHKEHFETHRELFEHVS